jgi:hypothetical protein
MNATIPMTAVISLAWSVHARHDAVRVDEVASAGGAVVALTAAL